MAVSGVLQLLGGGPGGGGAGTTSGTSGFFTLRSNRLAMKESRAEVWLQITAGKGPFRPEHKRKNWFVGVEVLEPVEETHFNAKDVKWETMRASGPGGQSRPPSGDALGAAPPAPSRRTHRRSLAPV